MDYRTKIFNWSKEIVYAVLLYLAIQGFLYLILGVYPAYRVVVSGSMEPVFYRGDVVVIKHVSAEDLKVGDIVVFYNKYSKTPIVHRIVKITEMENTLYFKTKGDNNPFEDSYFGDLPGVPQDRIVGKVIFKIPWIGKVSLWIRSLFHWL